MKLRGAALAAILAGSVLTGAAGASSTAGAATNPAVTIQAIDQAGNVVPVTASLQSLDGTVNITLTSGSPTKVPKDTYNIAAWVQEPHGSTVKTLVDREIAISKPVTVTFDARQGKPIVFTVNDPAVNMNLMTVEPFSPGAHIYAFQAPSAQYNPNGEPWDTYMVPGKLPPGWEVLVEVEMIPATIPPTEDYIFVRELKKSIPSNLTFASDKAKLATDRVIIRQVTDHVRPPARTALATLWPNLPGLTLPTTGYGQDVPAPYTLTFHVTPGYQYSQCASYGDGGCDSQGTMYVPVWHAGDHFSQTFGRAVFGPSPWLQADVTSTQLTAGSQQGFFLLLDPTQNMLSSGLPTATQQVWLYEGNKLLGHATNGTVTVGKISSAAHWYRMVIAASRGPGASLFKSLTLSYSFPAHANSGGTDSITSFWPRIVPAGLSERNAASAGTKTTVPMWFTGMTANDGTGNIAVHDVKVWASVNGGKTWTALPVSHTGSRWTVVVTNPAKPGYVSLRVRATNAAGSNAAVTIVNAYAVS